MQKWNQRPPVPAERPKAPDPPEQPDPPEKKGGGWGLLLGFGGDVTLPDSWNETMGLKAGTPINLAGQYSAGNACLMVGIGDPV